MKSNTANLMNSGTPYQITCVLQVAADFQLDDQRRESVEGIVTSLGTQPTVSDFVEAAIEEPRLREFAIKVGACCLPGAGYSNLYEREYGSLRA